MSTSTGRARHRIEFEGELDIARKDELERIFDSIEKNGPLTMDLRRVTYVDSTFLRLLASLALRFQEMPIRLVVATANLRRVLGIVQFEKLFQIVDND